MTPELLTFAQAAERLNVRESWLRCKVTAREIPFTRLGRQVRFTEAQIAEFIEANAEAPVQPRRRLRVARP